jgi:RNA polymerase sigma factor (sigma-70 family)
MFKIASGDSRYDELLSVAIVAMWKAALGFDVSRGVKFSTYASKSIMRELIKERERHDKVPRAKNPLDMGFYLADPMSIEPVDAMIAEEGKQIPPNIEKALNTLPMVDRIVLIRRRMYGESLEQIGADLGCCKERVRQLENRALYLIRHRLGLPFDGENGKGIRMLSYRPKTRRCRKCSREIPNIGCRKYCRPGIGCRKREAPEPAVIHPGKSNGKVFTGYKGK